MKAHGTPIHAVVDGTIRKLFTSRAGGTTIYEFDSSETYCYYYAHLDRYADGLHESVAVKHGQILGYVGTSGNAAPDAPQLHLAIDRLGPDKRWWQGTPIDPYPVLLEFHPEIVQLDVPQAPLRLLASNSCRLPAMGRRFTRPLRIARYWHDYRVSQWPTS